MRENGSNKDHKDYWADSYPVITLAQYLSGLSTDQDMWTEIGRALLRFLDLCVVGFGQANDKDIIELNHFRFSNEEFNSIWGNIFNEESRNSAEIKRLITDTLESGFLTTHILAGPDPLVLVFLPLVKENKTNAVLLFGYPGPGPFQKKTLNLYLAVTGLVATTIARLDSEREVQKHRHQLEELVQERTAELQEEIAQRKKSEEEKIILMRELNHRVKNNLSMISSLINLKNESIGTKVDLSDISHQIDAICIIHEKLYKTDKITHIEMNNYIESLLETIFSFTDSQVTVTQNIQQIELTTKRAVPLGLLVNEVATNAIKYGFIGEQEAIFEVDMRVDKENSCYILELSNNGRPFPDDVSLNNPETLGLRLIVSLVNQLQGTIELQRHPHTLFTIRFPL